MNAGNFEFVKIVKWPDLCGSGIEDRFQKGAVINVLRKSSESLST